MISAKLQRSLVSAALAIAVIAVYAPVTGYDFIKIDDAEYVRENANINGGFSASAIKWAFENSVTGNWHPLTMFSHMLDCQIYGLYAGGHHFTNVLLHVANTLLLFWVLLAMTRPITEKTVSCTENLPLRADHVPQNFWPCALVAALFGLHPLHVESVAWISERKDVLSAFFFLLTLWAYSNYAKKENSDAPSPLLKTARPGWWYALSLVFFVMGLMAKPMLVALPFVLLLLDYWPLGRLQKPATGSKSIITLVIEKIPFFLLAGIFSAITYVTQKSAGAIVALNDLPLGARLAGVMVSYAHYVGKLFWPDALAMPYPWHDWPTGWIIASTALFLGLSLFSVLVARRQPFVFVGWWMFVGMLVPVIGLVQVGQTAMADHYAYLPLIGLFIALAWWLARLAASPLRRALVPSGATLAAAILAVFAILAAIQVRYWKNSETLFGHALRINDHNPVAHYILGALCDSQGKPDEARAHFEASIRDNPANPKALCALGHIFCDEGKYDEATSEYMAAVRFAPGSAKAHFGLAEVMMKQHDFNGAMEHYLLALKANPNIAGAHYQLAALFSAKQDMPDAISHLEQAVRLAPDLVLALNNLGWILATETDPKLRNGAEATRLAMRAVLLTGRNNPNTLDTLAAAYAETGQFAEATDTARTAIQNANAAGQTKLAEEIGSRLKLYQSQQAYRE